MNLKIIFLFGKKNLRRPKVLIISSNKSYKKNQVVRRKRIFISDLGFKRFFRLQKCFQHICQRYSIIIQGFYIEDIINVPKKSPNLPIFNKFYCLALKEWNWNDLDILGFSSVIILIKKFESLLLFTFFYILSFIWRRKKIILKLKPLLPPQELARVNLVWSN